MPTVTVLAPDSALAMDEVIRQLGDNAYILATHTLNGQVEILATNEPAQIQPQRKRATSVSFADVISEQVAQGVAKPAIFKSVRGMVADDVEKPPEPTPTRSATVVMMPQARTQLAEANALARPDDIRAVKDDGAVSISASNAPREDTSAERQKTGNAPTEAIPTPAQPITQAPPRSAMPPVEDMSPLLGELLSRLARLEAMAAPQPLGTEPAHDPIQTAGFSAELAKRLAPHHTDPKRITSFASALARTLVAPDPIMSLCAPVVVIVGPSGAGKTVLAGKIAALTLETQTHRKIELVSLSETPPMANPALPIYARMLSIHHRNLHPDQLNASQILNPNTTHVFDTNLDHATLSHSLSDLRTQIGGKEIVVIIALPVGSSSGRIWTELRKYKDFDPIIALTKLDEYELSPEEASQIAETGMRIAWLSGTRALTETMAPATEDMMREFLTGLLAARS